MGIVRQSEQARQDQNRTINW